MQSTKRALRFANCSQSGGYCCGERGCSLQIEQLIFLTSEAHLELLTHHAGRTARSGAKQEANSCTNMARLLGFPSQPAPLLHWWSWESWARPRASLLHTCCRAAFLFAFELRNTMEIITAGRYRRLIIDEGKQAKQFRNVSLGARSVPRLGNCSCPLQPCSVSQQGGSTGYLSFPTALL